MAIETELKLGLSPRHARALQAHPLLAGLPALQQRLRNAYYDTPDLELKARRIALRFRQKGKDWLLTVKSAEPASGGLARRSEWEYPAQPGIFDFSGVDDSELCDWLETRREQLQPVFRTDFTRTAWQLDPCPGCRIEVALDLGYIDASEQRTRLCEVELELISGTVADLYHVALTLAASIPLRPVAASKAERGFQLAQGHDAPPCGTIAVKLHKKQDVISAFQTVAFAALEQITRNEAGVLSSDDPEFIHQMRIGIRRLRTAIKLWKPVLPRAFRVDSTALLKTMALTLGAARDWDVIRHEVLPMFSADFPGHQLSGPLQQILIQAAHQARQSARRIIRAPAWGLGLLRVAAQLHALPADGEARKMPDFAATRIKRLRLTQRHARRSMCGLRTALHRHRIACKKLRYGIECLNDVLKNKNRRQRKRLVRQQTKLGHHHDFVVAAALLAPILEHHPDTLLQGWLAGQLTSMEAALLGKPD